MPIASGGLIWFWQGRRGGATKSKAKPARIPAPFGPKETRLDPMRVLMLAYGAGLIR
jgi:hypothetical protein